MNSETSIVARQYRLQEWADLIRECNNRPDKMMIKQWCDQHSISQAMNRFFPNFVECNVIKCYNLYKK